MPASLVKQYLDNHNIEYVTILHSPAYTAQGIAASAHVPGREFAKTVIVRMDDRLAMAVLPAPHKIMLELLREVSGAEHVALASEAEFTSRFPDCEPGAMPPFGNLYGMDVFVGESLMDDEYIVFNAGSHHELIRMRYKDFERVVEPMIVKLSRAAMY